MAENERRADIDKLGRDEGDREVIALAQKSIEGLKEKRKSIVQKFRAGE